MDRARSIRNGLLAAVIAWAGCEGISPVEPNEPPGPVSAAELPDDCPDEWEERTPEEVLQDLRAALASGDLDAAMCNYALDAKVISDGGIDETHEQIRATLQFNLDLYGGTQPQVVQELAVPVFESEMHVVRVLWTIDTACVSVPDGVDTYVIHEGGIHGQTSHGFPVFHCFP